jgi:hypothetical protein
MQWLGFMLLAGLMQVSRCCSGAAAAVMTAAPVPEGPH